MLRSIRKHSKVIKFIFGVIMIAFIGQEISFYFFKKDKNDEDLGAVFIFDGSETKYYEYKNRVSRLQQAFTENKMDPNSFLFSIYKKGIIDEMILEKGYAKIAKNLHFIISRDEAISLYNDSNNQMLYSMQKRGEDIVKIREEIDKKMIEIADSPILSSFFIDSEQERNDYRNQVKIKKLFENLSSYPKWKANIEFDIKNSMIDIDYFYVLQDKNDDIVITDEEYKQHVEKNLFYKYKEIEKYKVKYIKVNYPFSEEDTKKNKESLEALANKFSKITEKHEVFAKLQSDTLLSKKTNETSLFLSEKDLPEVIKSSAKKEIGSLFIKIAKDSADFNAIYKIFKIEEDKDNLANEKKYHIAVIYKNPIVAPKTKKEFFSSFKEKVKDIKTSQQIEDFAKNNQYTLEEVNVLPDTELVRDFENSRKMVVSINKKCRKIFGNDIFVIEAREQTNNCIFGIVSEHVNERAPLTEKDKKKMEPELKRKKKNKILFDMMREKNILDSSFEELETKLNDKNFEFLKKGSAKVKLSGDSIKGFGPVDFSVLSLLKEGSQTPFFEAPRGIIKVLIKGISCEKANAQEFDKFYSEKVKGYKTPSMKKVFKKIFNVKVMIDEVV